MGKVLQLCIVFILIAFFAKAQAPCSISVDLDKGCVPLPVSFTFNHTNTSPVDSILWDFGDGNSSSQSKPTNIYKATGIYTSKVSVTFKNGTKCTVTRLIHVYASPNADFIVNNNQPIILCNRGNSLCFQDKSTPGKDKTPILSWQWDFGDGQTSTKQSPCYVYSDSGTYNVKLSVADTNGCQNLVQKTVIVRFASDIGINASPSFNISVFFNCKTNTSRLIFNNTTDTTKQFITKFIWDFGDGTKDSCDLRTPGCITKWTGFQHLYTIAGTYKPSLYIENKYGCSGKISADTPVILDTTVNTIQITPAHCFVPDSSVYFNATYDPLAAYYTWDFGDPYNRDMGALASTEHNFSRPGIYTVFFKRKVASCIIDTIMCKVIKLYGPVAKIMPVKGKAEAWDSVPRNGSSLIPDSLKKYYFDSCVGTGSRFYNLYTPTNGGISIDQQLNVPVTYYTYAPKFIPNGEPIYDTCRADTIRTYQKDSLMQCNGKRVANILISYKPHVRGFKDTTIQVATKHSWVVGDPIPSGNVYSDTPFVNRPLYMDDTSLFSIRCEAPQKITFTNFSDKYRGYDAVDNFPPGYPDKCKNPVYPYASDSLSYTWDFGEGSPNYASKQHPNPYYRYSTEKLPTHIYQNNGCYWVVLKVTDTATNCFDEDSIPVVLEAADAGWAPQYANIKDMTWLIQQSLPAKGPRRGMQITGPPCVNDTQDINLNETLPSCYKRTFAIVLDSAKQVLKCDNKTSWDWYDKNQIMNKIGMGFLYDQQDTGWKTIGLVVSNNSYCTDTVWYHDYKYIHGIYPAIKVSAQHICPGDTLKMSPLIPQQLGIKSFVYYFTEQLDRGDTNAKFKNDTIAYRVVNDAESSHDTITSTVHNKLWGIDDGPLNFNNLKDTLKKVVMQPGHFLITTVIKSRFGCIDTGRTQITVGHYSDFSADNNIVCVNDTVHFSGLGQYFVPFTATNSGYSDILYWNNPDSARNGRKPKIPELMQWDMNGDSVLDTVGVNPYFIYKKPGSYSVTLYTRDSSGCIQKLVKKDFIKVIDATAYFTVDSPGVTRYCSGSHFFNFKDSSYVIKPFKDSIDRFKIYSWTWDFGDGTAPITILDPAKKNTSHFYIKNGDYTVKLKVSTSPSGGTKSTACTDSFQLTIHILGPISNFSIIGPDSGCVPFVLTVWDKSKKATIKLWILGNGTTYTPPNLTDTIVHLVYPQPGVFCPQLFVGDTIIDPQGKPLFCVDTFPSIRCALKVTVFDTDRQALSATDTLLCAGRDVDIFKSTPDTGYKTWTIKFGDGDSTTSTTPKFSHIYSKIGKYHVSIGGSGARCPDSSNINVRVIDIKADFVVDTALKDTPIFSFINRSTGGVRYTWDFGDGSALVTTNSLKEISHEFIRAGTSTICMKAYNEKGCADSFCQTITIDTLIRMYNVFTPNGDAFNNHYVVVIYGNQYYDLDIYNRWGQKVFHSNDKNYTWDGTDAATGKLYPDGAYYAVFSYRFIGGRTERKETAVTLIR